MDIKLAGNQVNAVITTGIYCRAGCAARPNPENTIRHSSHIAAEAAGFRPCLRCRPDQLTPVPVEPEAPEPVVRALLSITDGFLDHMGEPELGHAVGMSPRQLRRLFLTHVGATPNAVARSRRAHFARRLLDETDLPVTSIATAAGFRTARQMNRVMIEIFRFSPTDLRSRRRKADRLVADGGIALSIPFNQPFDFHRILGYLDKRAIPGVESVQGGSYRRTTSTCGFPGAIEVSQTSNECSLKLTAHLPTFDSLIDDVANCRRLFGLDFDLGQAKSDLSEDESIGYQVTQRPGITVPGAWDRFETAVRIMVGQQISVKAASSITGRIATEFGQQVTGLQQFGLSRIFPSAQILAQADLTKVGMPGSRADSIQGFSQAVASREIDLTSHLPFSDLIAQLTELPGIGPWTANLMAMRVFGHRDAFPGSDLGLKKGLEKLRATNPAAANVMIEGWKPWRSIAAMYLWTMD